MQTAVEWLEKEIYARGPIGEDTPIWLKELSEQAKEMEEKQRKDDYLAGLNAKEDIEYYNETYGSKGSDEHIVETNKMISDEEKTNSQRFDEFMDLVKSSQTEISDEEIYKASIDYDNGATYETPIGHFIAGAKWYREQLKKKQ